MTKSGKLTKIDYIDAIVDAILPNDIYAGLDAVSLKSVITSGILHDFSCTKDVLISFADQLGLTAKLKEFEEQYIAKISIDKDLSHSVYKI